MKHAIKHIAAGICFIIKYFFAVPVRSIGIKYAPTIFSFFNGNT